MLAFSTDSGLYVIRVFDWQVTYTFIHCGTCLIAQDLSWETVVSASLVLYIALP